MTWNAADLASQWTALTGLPVWAAAAGFAAFLFILILLVRANKSLANVLLALITLGALGVIAADAGGWLRLSASRSSSQSTQTISGAGLPALACLDELAGKTVTDACEKAIFASPATVAAAVSYVSAQISQITAVKGATTTPELYALRRAVEADRYGMVAHISMTRDSCTASSCALFAYLFDSKAITRNMSDGKYDLLVAKYASTWSSDAPRDGTAPAAMTGPATGPVVATPPGPGVDFPSASSIPPVSIMNDPASEPVQAQPQKARTPLPPARKPPPKARAAPVPLTPAASDDDAE